jgi:phosphatidylglycerophosphate synthase
VHKNVRQNFASAITCLRVLVVPLMYNAVIHEKITLAFSLLIFACLTDLLDGYIARRMESTSSFGAYFDVMADFLFIFTSFTAFIQKGIYPGWVLFVFAGMFGQFLLTSKWRILTYDSIGRYYGAILFVIVGLTLLFVDFAFQYVMLTSIVLLSMISVVSRWLSLIKKTVASRMNIHPTRYRSSDSSSQI